MRYLIVLLLLAGCSYNLVLVPRGGGDVARGTMDGLGHVIEVTLKNETYRGQSTRGTAFGFSGTAATVVNTNMFTATLLSGSKALRCEFMAQLSGGNGTCTDGKMVYDLVITQ